MGKTVAVLIDNHIPICPIANIGTEIKYQNQNDTFLFYNYTYLAFKQSQKLTDFSYMLLGHLTVCFRPLST